VIATEESRGDSRRRRLACLLAIGIAVATPARAQEARPGADLAARPGTWPGAAGPASGSGWAAEPTFRETPVEAWTHEPRGTLEEEPLVWGGQVFVSSVEARSRRAFETLDLATGRRLHSQTFAAATPLTPAVDGTTVALRTAAARVELLRRTARGLQRLRTIAGERYVSPPVLAEDGLYLVVDDELRRYDPAQREPVWTRELGSRLRGRPVPLAGSVLVAGYDASGNLLVHRVHRADGRDRGAPLAAGHHGGKVPDATGALELSAFGDWAFVRPALGLLAADGNPRTHARLALGGSTGGANGLLDLAGAPAPWRNGWLARSKASEGDRWLAVEYVDLQATGVTLAQRESHARLLAFDAPATRAGDLLLIGDLARSTPRRSTCCGVRARPRRCGAFRPAERCWSSTASAWSRCGRRPGPSRRPSARRARSRSARSGSRPRPGSHWPARRCAPATPR
jgi:hypothetical protein